MIVLLCFTARYMGAGTIKQFQRNRPWKTIMSKHDQTTYTNITSLIDNVFIEISKNSYPILKPTKLLNMIYANEVSLDTMSKLINHLETDYKRKSNEDLAINPVDTANNTNDAILALIDVLNIIMKYRYIVSHYKQIQGLLKETDGYLAHLNNLSTFSGLQPNSLLPQFEEYSDDASSSPISVDLIFDDV